MQDSLKIEENLRKLMMEFKVPDGYKKTKYYGVSLMKLKKNGKYSLKLLYDYVKGNSIASNAIEISDCEKALRIYKLLDDRSTFELSKSKIEDIDL
jgi:hypothetical protein